jgi:DinB superfamily
MTQTNTGTDESKAYQRKLEGLVGDNEPLKVLADTIETLRDIVRQTPAALFRKRPFPGKWTPQEVLGHLTDGEWTMGFRTRTVLADNRPQIMAYDQERWVAAQDHNERDVGELLNTFVALRTANLQLWKKLTPAQLERSGLHSERGEESLGKMLKMMAGHDRSHIDQIRRYLEAAKG